MARTLGDTPGAGRWPGRALLALTLALAAGPAPAQDPSALKAAIVVNLLQFVQWPDDAGPASTTALRLCADRTGALWPALASLQQHAPRGQRPVELKDVPAAAEGLKDCDAWLLEPVPAARRGLAAAAAAGRPVLVIGDTGRADEPGQTIVLRLQGERLGFEVDLAAARRGGLQVSSKLLRLALKVRE